MISIRTRKDEAIESMQDLYVDVFDAVESLTLPNNENTTQPSLQPHIDFDGAVMWQSVPKGVRSPTVLARLIERDVFGSHENARPELDEAKQIFHLSRCIYII